jgi:hypothetical protein
MWIQGNYAGAGSSAGSSFQPYSSILRGDATAAIVDILAQANNSIVTVHAGGFNPTNLVATWKSVNGGGSGNSETISGSVTASNITANGTITGNGSGITNARSWQTLIGGSSVAASATASTITYFTSFTSGQSTSPSVIRFMPLPVSYTIASNLSVVLSLSLNAGTNPAIFFCTNNTLVPNMFITFNGNGGSVWGISNLSTTCSMVGVTNYGWALSNNSPNTLSFFSQNSIAVQ